MIGLLVCVWNVCACACARGVGVGDQGCVVKGLLRFVIPFIPILTLVVVRVWGWGILRQGQTLAGGRVRVSVERW